MNSPKPRSVAVQSQMRAMRTENTAPEMALRRELHRLGLRYRLHRKGLPGRPDVVFGPAKIAVFVDGCFWHGCPEHFVQPKNNADFWREKIEGNRARDLRKDAELKERGWLPVHVWEHEEPAAAAARIADLVVSRR